jgi:hypothetical protein
MTKIALGPHFQGSFLTYTDLKAPYLHIGLQVVQVGIATYEVKRDKSQLITITTAKIITTLNLKVKCFHLSMDIVEARVPA